MAFSSEAASRTTLGQRIKIPVAGPDGATSNSVTESVRREARTAATLGEQPHGVHTCPPRLRLSPYKVFGFGRGVHFTGLFIGAMIALFIATPPELFQELFTPVSLLMVFTLIIASTLVLTENELLGKGFHSFARPTSKDQDEEDLTTTLKRAKWRERCKAIAQEYNLSPREEEVLLLLAKGRDTVFIQSEFGISNHTARSHVYHIYQKLNVHSKQELLNFIENAKDGEVL